MGNESDNFHDRNFKLESTHTVLEYKQPLTKNPDDIKGFLNIIQFIEQNPNKVISHLKKKKGFIGKWFLEYLNNITQIKSRNISINFQSNLITCHNWVNSFLSLIDKYIDDCKNNNESSKRCSCGSVEACKNNFYSILKILCPDSDDNTNSCSNCIKKLIEPRFLENKRTFYKKSSVCFASSMKFSLMSYEKTRELLDKDISNETQYLIGIQKRIKNNFPLLRIIFERIDRETYSKEFKEKFRTYYEYFFKDELPDGFNIREYELYLVNLLSLFYQFFWDLLNEKIFRDIPDTYTVIKKTDNEHYLEAIIAFNEAQQEEGTNNEKLINNIEEDNYDPLFKEKYHHFFKHEWITGDEFFHFLDLICKLIENKHIPQKPEISNLIRKKLDNFVKYKIFLRTDAKYKNKIIPDITHRTIQKRYHDYQTFLNLYNLVYSLMDIRLRRRKRYFDRKLILDFIIKINKGFTQKKARELVFSDRSISYSRLNEYLNDWKKLIIGKEKSRKTKVNEIIELLSEEELEKWIDQIEEYEKNREI